MPAWCRPCAKCPLSRRSWGCRGFFLSAFWRRYVWRRWCSGRRVACQISSRLVACLEGPGRCVCRWAAARPRDRHTRACGSEWSISRPALAPPPPSGTAAWPSGPSGALHTGGAVLLCVAGRVGSKPALAPPPPSGTAAWPSSPSGALHTSGAGLVRWLVVWLGPAACCRRHGGSRVLSFWGGLVRVVTNVVNPRCF